MREASHSGTEPSGSDTVFANLFSFRHPCSFPFWISWTCPCLENSSFCDETHPLLQNHSLHCQNCRGHRGTERQVLTCIQPYTCKNQHRYIVHRNTYTKANPHIHCTQTLTNTHIEEIIIATTCVEEFVLQQNTIFLTRSVFSSCPSTSSPPSLSPSSY